MHADLARRFGGVARLYGTQAAEYIAQAHVCIVGIGGVGTWAVEALARSGVGELTLIDLDMVAESNTNRQLHALDGQYGRAKVEVMAERCTAINPAVKIHCIEDFVTPDNLASLLSSQYHAVVDAIDQVRAKSALIAFCKANGMPIVTAGAAGGQMDPTQIRVADLTQTIQDPLLAKVRSQLRRDHGFPRGGKQKFGVPAVYSLEPLRYPAPAEGCDLPSAPTGLNCAGFGSSVCVTAVFGMTAAATILNLISQA